MSDESLVTVAATPRLAVMPIWEYPVDPHEGRLYAKYITKNPSYNSVYLRTAVYEMLLKAADRLPPQFRLIIRAGHRPLGVQRELLSMVANDYRAQHPDASDTEVLAFARTYVSDPDVKLPPHCCGAAVDVDMLNITTNQLVDFGCPVNTDSEVAFLNTDQITKIQQGNREMLLAAMLGVGFAPYTYEWWHFSFRDQTWADFYKKTDTLYEIIEP